VKRELLQVLSNRVLPATAGVFSPTTCFRPVSLFKSALCRRRFCRRGGSVMVAFRDRNSSSERHQRVKLGRLESWLNNDLIFATGVLRLMVEEVVGRLSARLSTGLSAGGCCAGLSAATPVEVFNRPGLSAVQYRSSTHALLKSTMLGRLSASQHPALQPLRARSDDDFAVALLDSWAVVWISELLSGADCQRIVPRTATGDGLAGAARLIGYEPRPRCDVHLLLSRWMIGASADASWPCHGATCQQVIIERGQVKVFRGPAKAQMFGSIERSSRFSWNISLLV
jgi:hypothetical protein